MFWNVIDSGRMAPQAIMAKDAQLLDQLGMLTKPVLHFYEWEGSCLTYGYFTDPLKYLKKSALEKHQLLMARRPTGGGIIFHLTDFAFSVLVPASSPWFSLNTLENYKLVNQLTAQAIEHLFNQSITPQLLDLTTACADQPCVPFCMAKPTQYDLMFQGKKLGGAAQRRTKNGFLHQGSISISLPPSQLLQDVLKDSKVVEAMQETTYTLMESPAEEDLYAVRQALKQQLGRLDFKGNSAMIFSVS